MTGVRIFQGAVSTYWLDRNQHPREGWQLIRDIGIDGVKVSVDSSRIISDPYQYDFAMRFDRDIELFMQLKFKTIIVSPMWAPPHMVIGPPDEYAGRPVYSEYVYGPCVYTGGPNNEWRFGDCCAYTADGIRREADAWPVPNSCGRGKDDPRHQMSIVGHYTMDHHEFLPEKPWALLPNVPHIDPDQMEHYGAAVATRLVMLAERYHFPIEEILFANWNELGGKHYWPPVQSPPYPPAFDRFVAEVWVPYMRGVRSVIPNAFFVGPDAESPSSLSHFLDAVKRVPPVAAEPNQWLPNRISGHLYTAGEQFPEGTINEITRKGGWEEVMRRHGYTELWNTEYTDRLGNVPSPGTLVSGTRELTERFPWIVMHCPHDPDYYVEGGKEAWAAGRFVPNQAARDMKTLIGGNVDPVPTPPPPSTFVPGKRAYRIVDMRKYVTRDRVYNWPMYLFVAVRQPALDVVRGPALNTETTFRGDEYVIVPVTNDALVRGDQYFEIRLPFSGEAWFGPTKWSELPEAKMVDLWVEDGGRRRGVRS